MVFAVDYLYILIIIQDFCNTVQFKTLFITRTKVAFGPRISELGEQGYGPKTKTFQPSHENYYGDNYYY